MSVETGGRERIEITTSTPFFFLSLTLSSDSQKKKKNSTSTSKPPSKILSGKLAGLDKKLSRSLDAEVATGCSPAELSKSPVGPLSDAGEREPLLCFWPSFFFVFFSRRSTQLTQQTFFPFPPHHHHHHRQKKKKKKQAPGGPASTRS